MTPPELEGTAPQLFKEPSSPAAELDGLSYDSMIKALVIPTSPSSFVDLKWVLRQGANLEDDALDRARWLTATEYFVAWAISLLELGICILDALFLLFTS